MASLFLCFPSVVPPSNAANPPASSLTDDSLRAIQFDQNLNQPISLDLRFRDEQGSEVKLGDYFGKKPVILVLGYYECPMLCTLVLNGLVESLQDLKLDVGTDFEVVDVSIDPKETPKLAAAKKTTCLKRYGRRGASGGWHFLTGDEPAIRRLADEVGFRYAYDPAIDQYAHPSGFVLVTPKGKIARYFFGVSFSPGELNTALRNAGENEVGSPVDQLILLCFHYAPLRGKYGNLIMTCVRVSGVATMAGLAFAIGIIAVRRAKRNRTTQTLPSFDSEVEATPEREQPAKREAEP